MIVDERNEEDRENILENAASQEEPIFYDQEEPLDEEGIVSKNRRSKIETFKNGLIVEFVISSIILWSFILFMAYGFYQNEIQTCKEILSQPSKITVVKEVQEQVAEAIKKLID